MPAHKSVSGPLWLTLGAALVAAMVVVAFFSCLCKGERPHR